MTQNPFFLDSAPRGILAVALAALFSTGICPAETVFADDFVEEDGTLLNGKLPDIGPPWSVTMGEGLVIRDDGLLDTTGGARLIWGTLASSLSAERPLLELTVKVFGITHNSGWAGISLFSGETERIFLGDPGGDSSSWAVEVSANHARVYAEEHSGGQTFTLTYDFNTGTTALYEGASAAGTPIFQIEEPGNAGYIIDRIRIANGANGDIILDDIAVRIPSDEEPPLSALELVAHAIDPETGLASLTWTSIPGNSYRVTASLDLEDWSTVLLQNVTAETTQTHVQAPFTPAPKLFFRVEEE